MTSSVIGFYQEDIKKIIAYSTMSQLAQECNSHLITFRYQTICVDFNIFNNIKINSQITKAHDYRLNIHISYNLFNSSLINWLYKYIYINLSVGWKFIIISKLVGISEVIRLILIFIKLKIVNLIKNSFIFNKSLFIYKEIFFSKIFGTRKIHTAEYEKKIKDIKFIQWLAGLMDGDGQFILTKKGHSSCEITMYAKDIKALNEIKQKYGGSIKPLANANAVRYKLRHKKGLIFLINDVNGLIRNPAKLLQINKLCVKYNIKLKYPQPLTFNDGWLSGFIDSDGSIYYNQVSGQISISLTQKNKFLLEPLIKIYGGRIDILSPKVEAFKFVIYRKAELFYLIDNYFINYPLKTEKMKRINLVKDFYFFRLYINSLDIQKFNEWVKFKDKWEKYQD